MARDPRIWMWAEACEMLERAERLHRRFFEIGAADERGPAWEPPVDLYETDEHLYVLVALPGVVPAHISLRIEDHALVVGGVRPLPVTSRGAAIHRLEIPYGRFERRIRLPVGRVEYEQQELEYGCLLITLRKL